jgi:catechol 2,3-dioxygenase
VPGASLARRPSNAYREHHRRIDTSQDEDLTHTATDPATSLPRLPATLRLGAVHLTASDLDRSVAFYEDAIGLRLHVREGRVAAMRVGKEDLLVLDEDPKARRGATPASTTTRCSIHPVRSWRARRCGQRRRRPPIQGASDHGTHEAIYLPDPDGNGIELAADRPRERWPKPLNYAGGPHFLDFGLLAAGAGEEPRREAGPGLVVGHVHLHVGDLDRGLGFYHDVLGFELMTFLLSAAAFVSAGGYHHHLGFNVWRGEGGPPAPADRVGLRYWTVVLDDPGEVAAVRERVQAAGKTASPRGTGFDAPRHRKSHPLTFRRSGARSTRMTRSSLVMSAKYQSSSSWSWADSLARRYSPAPASSGTLLFSRAA